MSKLIIGVALMLFAAGSSHLYLDYLNKQEMVASRARDVADGRAKAERKSRFEAVIMNDLAYCFAEAEQQNSDYISHLHKIARLKPGKIAVTDAYLDKAAMMLKSAKEECQLTYEFRLKYPE